MGQAKPSEGRSLRAMALLWPRSPNSVAVLLVRFATARPSFASERALARTEPEIGLIYADWIESLTALVEDPESLHLLSHLFESISTLVTSSTHTAQWDIAA